MDVMGINSIMYINSKLFIKGIDGKLSIMGIDGKLFKLINMNIK